MALCQDEAEPEDISSCPGIIQGYTLLSPGRGDRESRNWHPICQEILLAAFKISSEACHLWPPPLLLPSVKPPLSEVIISLVS